VGVDINIAAGTTVFDVLQGATTGGCPYQNENYVDVVRHHDERVQSHGGVTQWQFAQHCVHHPPHCVQFHFAPYDFAKQDRSASPAALDANRDKIGTRRRVVVPALPRGSTVKPLHHP
jgi:hypothetical protein